MRVAAVVPFILACGARTELGEHPLGAHERSFDASTDLQPDVHADTDASPPPPVTCAITSQTVLAATAMGLDQIAASGAFLYFHDMRGVSRVSKGGGPVQPIATMPLGAWPEYAHFVVDSQNVTWVASDATLTSSTLASTPVDGGASSIVASLPGRYDAVKDDNGALLVWPTYGGPNVLERVAGGLTTVVTTLPEVTMQVIVDGNVLYGGAGLGGVFRYDGQVTTLGTQGIADLAFDGATLFFTGGNEFPNPPPSVWRVDLPSGIATQLTAPAPEMLGGVAVDESHVYFANRDTGRVERIGKHGEARTVVGGADGTQPIDVAVDDVCVYWTALDDPRGAPGGHVYAAPR